MKKLLIIFCLLFSTAYAQTITGHPFVTTNTNTPALRPILVIIAGESNAGSQYALNTGLPTVDTQAFAHSFIYNNRTHTIQNLHIGTNDVLLHTGITDNSCHAFELEIALQTEANQTKFHAPVYFVKAGQGGSTIGQWQKGVGPFYYDTLLSRVNNTLAIMGGHPQIFLLWTQGINDGCSTVGCFTTWQTNTSTFFAQLRSDLSTYTVNILVPLFTEPGMGGIGFNAYYSNIAAVTSYMRVCDTYGATLANGFHWDTPGVNAVADILITQMLGMLSEY